MDYRYDIPVEYCPSISCCLRLSEYLFAASRGETVSLPGRASMTARFFLHCQVRSGHSGIETLRPWCGQTLDRVENGGSGSDLNARERKDGKGAKSTSKRSFGP